MYVLTWSTGNNQIDYKIHKLYRKKSNLHSSGKVIITPKNIIWNIFNANGTLKNQLNLSATKNNLHVNICRQLINSEYFTKYNFDFIVHKIACGGNTYHNISRLNQANIDNLQEFSKFAPIEQTINIDTAHELLKTFTQTKHYACFDSGFFHEVANPCMTPFGEIAPTFKLANYGKLGLNFESISKKIPDLIDKKQIKGKWIIVHLSNSDTIVCAIKNGKCVYTSSSYIHAELPSLENTGIVCTDLLNNIAHELKLRPIELLKSINSGLSAMSNHDFSSITELLSQDAQLGDYYTTQITNKISNLIVQMGGLNGIIFSGELGNNSPKLRELICNKLNYFDINLNHKANSDNTTKISRKSSAIELFTMESDAHATMINQLYERF